jgi:hypothetical protein
MNEYLVDWVGGLGAVVAFSIAFLVVRAIMRRSNGVGFYVVVALLGGVLSVSLRTVLRHFGI